MPVPPGRDWRPTEMRFEGGYTYLATIPANQIDPHFEWQCFVEFLGLHGGKCWPPWEKGQPYVVRHPPNR